MSVAFEQIPGDLLIPLFHVEVQSAGPTNLSPTNPPILLGQGVTVGTFDVPTLIAGGNNGASQARSLWGTGSQIARMVAAFRENQPFAELWAIAEPDDGAAVKAVYTITFGGVATADGTIYLYVAGRRFVIQVPDTTTAAALSALVQTELLAAEGRINLPIVPTQATVINTLTAINGGEIGNDIDVDFNLNDGEALPAGITILVAQTVVGSANPDVSAVGGIVETLADTPYDVIAWPWTDTTNLNALKAELSNDTGGRWGFDRQIYGVSVSAMKDTAGGHTTFLNGRNDEHSSILAVEDTAIVMSDEEAARVTARVAIAAANDPTRPFQTLELKGSLPAAPTDRFLQSTRQTLLTDGGSTYNTSKTGVRRIEFIASTYQTDTLGNPDDAWKPLNASFTVMAILRRLRIVVTSLFPRHTLVGDDINIPPGTAAVNPETIKGTLVSEYTSMSKGVNADGTPGPILVEDVAAFEAGLIVVRDGTNKDRINVLFPADIANQLRVFATLFRFRR